MADMFELNMNKYTMRELEELLDLHTPYTMENIVAQSTQLHEKLLADPNVSAAKKREILHFLSEVKKKLIKNSKHQMKHTMKAATPHQAIQSVGAHEVLLPPQENASINTLDKTTGRIHGKKRTMQRLLCFDSQFRENYYTTDSTNYSLTLQTPLKNVISMELASLELPSTFYNISRNNNTDYFWLFWNSGASKTGSHPLPLDLREGAWFYIHIPAGNYRFCSDIVSTINAQIALATTTYRIASATADPSIFFNPPLFYYQTGFSDSGAAGIGTAWRSTTTKIMCGIHSPLVVPDGSGNACQQEIKLAFNRTRGSFMSTVHNAPVPPNCLPPIDVESIGGIQTKLGWILGYRLAEYTNQGGYHELNTAGSWNNGIELLDASCNRLVPTYVTEGQFDGWGYKYVYVVVKDYNISQNDYIIPTFTKSIGAANILAKATIDPSIINVNGYILSNGAMEADHNSLFTRKYFGPVTIKKLHFQLLDPFGRILTLNNMDLSFALNCTCLYDY